MVFRKGDLYARCIKIIGFRIHSSKIFKFHNEAKRAFPSVSINFLQIRMRQFSRRYIIILTLYNKRREWFIEWGRKSIPNAIRFRIKCEQIFMTEWEMSRRKRFYMFQVHWANYSTSNAAKLQLDKNLYFNTTSVSDIQLLVKHLLASRHMTYFFILFFFFY